MPLFVHYPEYICTHIQKSDALHKEHYQFELTIKRAGSPFENRLTLCLNEECTKLTYKMAQNPRLAYQLDFSYKSLNNKSAIDAIERYLVARTNTRFADINGEVFFYILLLSDTSVLDDFVGDPFTFRVLAERIKRNQPIRTLVTCNRHTLLLSCLSEHIINFDDSLADVHQAFIERAWLTPAIYRWLQRQPLLVDECDHALTLFSDQYKTDCISECSVLLELLSSSVKQRNRLLTQKIPMEALMQAVRAFGPKRVYYKILERLPLSELLNLCSVIPEPIDRYIREISTMLPEAMVHGEAFTQPTTASEVVDLYDDLLMAHIGNMVIDSSDCVKGIPENKSFCVFPLQSLSFVEPITCIDELREEGRIMNHCIYSNRYIEKLLSGNYFAYRVMGDERATLLLAKYFGALEIEQISGYANAKVSEALTRQINQAISALPVMQSENNSIVKNLG